MKAPNPSRRPTLSRPTPPARQPSARASTPRTNQRAPRQAQPPGDPTPLPEGVEQARPPQAGQQPPPGYSHVITGNGGITPAEPPTPQQPLIPMTKPPAHAPMAPPTAGFGADSLEAARLAMLTSSGPMSLEPFGDDGGAFFVRMINQANLVRAIPTGAVPTHLCRGWKFIVDEPSIPRVTCPTDRRDICDSEGYQGFYARSRPSTVQPVTHTDAMRVWMEELTKDIPRWKNRPELDCSFIHRLVSQFNRPKPE